MRYKTTNVLRLANTVRQNIQIEKLVNSNNLLITFSGGQDSAFCLLVLYLLNNQMRRQWNCKKVLNLSDHYNKKNTLTEQSCNPSLSLNDCRHDKQNTFYLSQARALFLQNKVLQTSMKFLFKENLNKSKPLLYRSLIPVTSLYHNSNANLLTFIDELRKQNFIQSFSKRRKINVKEKTLNYKQITGLIESYTLLWCNHFWQKDTFFTMEHVFKLSFSKNYTMHSFAPIKEILSEQNARHWRHKVMQRLSLFVLKRDYHFVELYFNYVFITTPFLFTRSKKRSDSLYKTKICHEHEKQIKTLDKGKALNKGLTGTTLLPKPCSLQIGTICTSIADDNCLHRFKFFHQNVIAEEKNTQNKVDLKKAQIPLGFDQNSPLSCLSLTKTKQSFVKEQLCVQGHNKSDRAEAILFNLMRGTGMNGLSTLQWKHTFFPPSNSNFQFYPIFSDFFKEIQIIHLNSFFVKSSLQKETRKANRSVFAVNQYFILLKTLLHQDLIIKPNEIRNPSLKIRANLNQCFYKNYVFVTSEAVYVNKLNTLKKLKVFLTTCDKNKVFFARSATKFLYTFFNNPVRCKWKTKHSFVTPFAQAKLIFLSKNFMVKTEQSYKETRLNFVGNKPSETFFMPSQKQIKPFYYQLKFAHKKT